MAHMVQHVQQQYLIKKVRHSDTAWVQIQCMLCLTLIVAVDSGKVVMSTMAKNECSGLEWRLLLRTHLMLTFVRETLLGDNEVEDGEGYEVDILEGDEVDSLEGDEVESLEGDEVESLEGDEVEILEGDEVESLEGDKEEFRD